MKKIFITISIFCCLYYNTNAQKKGTAIIKKSFMVIAPSNCQRSISIETFEVEEDFKIKIMHNIPIKDFSINDSSITFYHIYEKNFPKIFEAHIDKIILKGKLSPVQNIAGDTIGRYIIYGKFLYDSLLYIGNKKIKEIELK